MKIPDSVRIGGIEYPVSMEVRLNNGVNICYGHIDYEKCRIRLLDSDSMGHEKMCVVLLHEILHGIRYHAGLNIDNEEEVVDMFARGLYQVLQDNGGRLFDLERTEKNNAGVKKGCG